MTICNNVVYREQVRYQMCMITLLERKETELCLVCIALVCICVTMDFAG